MLSSQIELTQMICGKCGCVFAIPEFVRAEKEASGGDWFCPNGHARTYAESELDRLRTRGQELRKENLALEVKLCQAKRQIKKVHKPKKKK